MIWPDPTNSNVLEFVLFNPQGAIVQESYDDATPGRPASRRTSSMPRSPIPPRAGGRRSSCGAASTTSSKSPRPRPAAIAVRCRSACPGRTTAPHRPSARSRSRLAPACRYRSGSRCLSRPGDHPESVQLSASSGAADSVPIARRTLIPSGGGSFRAAIIGTSARGVGQIDTYEINVPAGRPDLERHAARDRRQRGQPVQLLPGRPERHGRGHREHAADGERPGGRRHRARPPPARLPDSGRSTSC